MSTLNGAVVSLICTVAQSAKASETCSALEQEHILAFAALNPSNPKPRRFEAVSLSP